MPRVLACLPLALAAACGPATGSPDPDAADADDVLDAEEAGEEFSWDAPPDRDTVDGTFYHPFEVLPSAAMTVPDGWQLRRGIIHAHSPYSHDACDDEPFVEGVRNEECFDQLRAAVCETGQDFLFLTDHAATFADHEFPDVLLYAPGDTLIERGGLPVANRVPCGDGREVLVAAGTETGTMPIGLEHHLGDTPAERHAAYDEVSAAGIQAFRDAGAVTFVQHTEEWDVEVLRSLGLDGIEIYNLHYNLEDRMGDAVNLVVDLQTRPWRVPIPELGLAALLAENEVDLATWSTLLADGRTVGVLATDVHRNVFDGTSPDGERIDSYRRLMHWFANYVLLPPGAVDDRALKDAIRHGRFYGSFDVFGYPVGFDFHATAGATRYELGDELPAAPAPTLHLALPTVHRLDPAGPQPAIRGRILRAAAGGTWEEVAAGDDDLAYVVAAPGAYRAEVRITPEHLRPWLGLRADLYVIERPWIYANPIYVVP
jgi:hypothetical protein